MNLKTKTLFAAVTTAFFSLGSLSAVIVPLEFNSISSVVGSSTTYSTAGDQWIATNVRADSPTTQVDAVFTITNTDNGLGSLLPQNTVGFVTESARGNNMRIRVGGNSNNRVATAYVFITIDFFQAGTTNPYIWGRSDELVTQFSDLDSDFGQNRADFGGSHVNDYDSRNTSDNVVPGSSRLVFNDTEITDYSIAHLNTPWGPEGNVTNTSASAQSPVTASFTRDATNSIRIVAGQLSNGDVGNRHIDIDMTPDFTIVPESSSFGLILGLVGLGTIGMRRRIR